MSTRPRIRTIKPEMWQDEAFGSLSIDARLLFVGLITMADDEGRLRAMPHLIIGHVYPYDDIRPSKVEKLLQEIAVSGLIVRYQAQNIPYIALPGWAKHQKINRPSPSILPAPSGFSLALVTDDSVNDHGEVTEDSLPHARAGAGRSDRKGSDQDQDRNPPSPPRGNRTRDLKSFEDEVRIYSQQIGIDSEDGWRNVAGAIRSGADSDDKILAYLSEWRPDLLPQNGAVA